MFKLKSIYKNSKEISQIKEIYFNSFTKEERIFLPFLLWKTKLDFVEFFALYSDEQLVGFVYLITDKGMTLMFYLAIDSRVRSNGYGKKAIKAIRSMYPNKAIVAEIEAVDEKTDNYGQRLKRERFYLKNGFRHTHLQVISSAGKYDLLVSGDDITAEDFEDIIKKYAGNILSLFIKLKLRQA